MKKIDLKQKYEILDKLFSNMNEDHIGEFSAQCSYYTILSFIPFIILLITMIQYTSIEQQAIFDAISKIIPSSMNDMVVGIVREVYSKSLGTICISILFPGWSAGKGLYALAKGLQSVYKTKGENRLDFIYLRLKSLVETIIFIFLIAVRVNFISIWK